MSDPTGGKLHDLRDLGKHYYYQDKREGRDTTPSLAFMGVVTVGIGCKMLYEAWKQTREGHRGFPGRGR